jgi:hypothetical protein
MAPAAGGAAGTSKSFSTTDRGPVMTTARDRVSCVRKSLLLGPLRSLATVSSRHPSARSELLFGAARLWCHTLTLAGSRPSLASTVETFSAEKTMESSVGSPDRFRNAGGSFRNDAPSIGFADPTRGGHLTLPGYPVNGAT